MLLSQFASGWKGKLQNLPLGPGGQITPLNPVVTGLASLPFTFCTAHLGGWQLVTPLALTWGPSSRPWGASSTLSTRQERACPTLEGDISQGAESSPEGRRDTQAVMCTHHWKDSSSHLGAERPGKPQGVRGPQPGRGLPRRKQQGPKKGATAKIRRKVAAAPSASPAPPPPHWRMGRETGPEFAIKLPSASWVQVRPLSQLRPHGKEDPIPSRQVLPLSWASQA